MATKRFKTVEVTISIPVQDNLFLEQASMKEIEDDVRELVELEYNVDVTNITITRL